MNVGAAAGAANIGAAGAEEADAEAGLQGDQGGLGAANVGAEAGVAAPGVEEGEARVEEDDEDSDGGEPEEEGQDGFDAEMEHDLCAEDKEQLESSIPLILEDLPSELPQSTWTAIAKATAFNHTKERPRRTAIPASSVTLGQ